MAIKYRELTLTCPACDTRFGTRAVLGASPLVTKGTDFHERYRVGESLLPHFVHFCDRCGFCAEEKYYNEEYELPFRAALADFVEEKLTPNLPWARQFLVDRYEHALKVAEFMDEPSTVMGEIALRGAWAAVEENDAESERFFRRAAANNYTTALQRFDMIARKQRASFTYLIGELWRRLGNYDLATAWFDAVEQAVESPDDQWVATLAKRQKTAPQEFM